MRKKGVVACRIAQRKTFKKLKRTYHSFPWWPDLVPFNGRTSLLKKSLEKVGERRELVIEELLIAFLGGIDELVELGAECGLCVLTHQLLELDDRLKK